MTVEELKGARFKFLSGLYDATGGSRNKIPDMFEVGESVGLARDLTDQITDFLHGEGLIQFPATGGAVQITQKGLRAVEDARSRPDRPTHFFPPVNFISIGTMTNSAIVQGSHAAHQEVHTNEPTTDSILAVLAEIRSSIDQLNLNADQAKDLKGDVATVEAQLTTTNPKKSIVSECLKSIRGILEKVGGVVASGLAAKLVERMTR